MLSQFLVTELFAFLLIFSRTGSALMLMPGIGEIYVPARVRLLLALAFSALLVPVLGSRLPGIPVEPAMVFALVFAEVLTGIFLGTLARILISAVHTAGTVIATQSGLAASMMLDITQTSQSTALTNLLTITALVLFFAMDLHHLMLSALVRSYEVFTPAALPPPADLAEYAITLASRTFAVATQLAAPHIVLGTLLYLASGVLSRLMPALQIFFILLPAQILVNFFLLMITVSAIMLWYTGYLEQTFTHFPQLEMPVNGAGL